MGGAKSDMGVPESPSNYQYVASMSQTIEKAPDTDTSHCLLSTIMYFLASLATIALASQGALAATAFGWATGTTGELTSSFRLEDSTPRTIILDKTYDFTDTEGDATGPGCVPWTCSPNAQLALDGPNWCASTPTKKSSVIFTKGTFTYKKAATTAIRIGSNKTLRGKGNSGWIKGKGLSIVGSTNIIIQNIRISDLNQKYVWGGDALTIWGGSKIWIDHNYFKDVGRQFIVTGFDPSMQVTISNNYFDGRATYTPFCDGYHYWGTIVSGKADTVTFAYNYVYHASGRAPKVGGDASSTQTIHMYNNYFHDISGHALDAAGGARILFEGNYIESVKTPSTGNKDGAVFAPTSSSMNAQCANAIGRNCVSNTLVSSGSLSNAANSGVLGDFKKSFVTSNRVLDASAVKAHVLANAGLGKI
ncbi:pectate lyase [Rhizoctonia solani]|uniref:pectin lyase n=1 Tax=Rhizoctonia solani TaxID=456999 RepID=A0A8H8P2C8_9AGAM|nr:pectate lyase [Rhizoctonia solani]QRW23032.1 pectate lyase [Rhizoctonia solani]